MFKLLFYINRKDKFFLFKDMAKYTVILVIINLLNSVFCNFYYNKYEGQVQGQDHGMIVMDWWRGFAYIIIIFIVYYLIRGFYIIGVQIGNNNATISHQTTLFFTHLAYIITVSIIMFFIFLTVSISNSGLDYLIIWSQYTII